MYIFTCSILMYEQKRRLNRSYLNFALVAQAGLPVLERQLVIPV